RLVDDLLGEQRRPYQRVASQVDLESVAARRLDLSRRLIRIITRLGVVEDHLRDDCHVVILEYFLCYLEQRLAFVVLHYSASFSPSGVFATIGSPSCPTGIRETLTCPRSMAWTNSCLT